eukprot:2204936-Pleurochrysis_carterae.AAC.2
MHLCVGICVCARVRVCVRTATLQFALALFATPRKLVSTDDWPPAMQKRAMAGAIPSQRPVELKRSRNRVEATIQAAGGCVAAPSTIFCGLTWLL